MPITQRTHPSSPIRGSLKDVGAVRLEVVEGAKKKLLNEYLQRYHPLGYRQPFGDRMRYFVRTDRKRLGRLLFSGAAKSLGARDRWIGWSQTQRLAWPVNLNRHLIFPWLQIRNLSSHVLGKLMRRVAEDWEKSWGYRPVLMETFLVLRHEGSSYEAAGWQELGMSTGEGLVRVGEQYRTTPKKTFVKPLCADFRALLCSELPPLGGWNEQGTLDRSTAAEESAQAAAGTRHRSHPTRPNRTSPHETVEEEQQARSEAAIEHARLIRRQLPALLKELSKIPDPRKPLLLKHKLTTPMLYGILMFLLRTGSRLPSSFGYCCPCLPEVPVGTS